MYEQAKLRSDVVIRRQDGGCILKDPRNGRFFRLGKMESMIAEQLDGKTPPEAVQRRAESKLGMTIPDEAAGAVAELLGRLGLLEDGQAGPERPQGPGRVGGSIFYLRLSAFDPDRFLIWLHSRTRFLFTRTFVYFSAALILAGMALSYSERSLLASEIRQLFHIHALILAWILLLAVTVLHEFAHGVTCKHFGGEVHELGFLLIYFQPAFYCNVSDAWLFNKKSQRLWVSIAGAYFEMFLWALATFLWRITTPDTWINFAALLVMATSAVKTMINLNPLIKLDGYYFLSDYLEIPNLRQKAMQYMAEVLRRPWSLLTTSADSPSWRQRRIYLTYGALASVYSWSLLGIVAWHAMEYFVARYQGLGLVIGSTLIGAVVRQTLPRTVPARPPEPQPMPRPIFRKTKKLLKAIGAAAAILAALYIVPMQLTVAGNFRLLPAQKTEVRAEVDGIIDQVLVDEGDTVKLGTVIARLSDRDIKAELQKTEAELQEQQARLRMLKIGTRPEELALAKATQEKAKERLPFARKDLERAQKLFQEGLAAQKEIDEAQEAVAVRQKELEEASSKLKLLVAGSRREEIEAAQSAVERQETQVRYLNEQRRLLEAVSPIQGVISTHRLKETVGQQVQRGDLIAEVDGLNTIEAEIAVPEREIADVKPGQPVEVKARAYPEKTFAGVVASIGTKAAREDDTLEGKSILVTTRLDNSSLLLKSGMTGSAKIVCGKRRMMDLLRRRIAKSMRIDLWTWW
jgi:putative peptide zinc metalloprotease protein